MEDEIPQPKKVVSNPKKTRKQPENHAKFEQKSVLKKRARKLSEKESKSMVTIEIKGEQLPKMKKKVELNEVEWGQVLDGLACRIALYEETVGYYEHGVSYGHIAEVRDADEARAILTYYQEIIQKLEKQLGKDGYVESIEDLRRNIS